MDAPLDGEKSLVFQIYDFFRLPHLTTRGACARIQKRDVSCPIRERENERVSQFRPHDGARFASKRFRLPCKGKKVAQCLAALQRPGLQLCGLYYLANFQPDHICSGYLLCDGRIQIHLARRREIVRIKPLSLGDRTGIYDDFG